MPDFKSMKDLNKYLEKMIADSMSDVGGKIVETTQEQVQKDVYDAYKPEEYRRTMELKNSLVFTPPIRDGEFISTTIMHDTNLIGSYAPNQHYSVVNGDSSIHSIAEIVHDGKSGLIFGTGVWTKPRPYFLNAKDLIQKDKIHVKAMKDALGKRGINIE